MHELSKLEVTIDELYEKHPGASFFIRGDANASPAQRLGNKRDSLFKYFCDSLSFLSSEVGHPTYHHFIGNTSSSIDVILQQSPSQSIPQEIVTEVLCSKSCANVDFKHDIILSAFHLPYSETEKLSQQNVIAPEVPNNKHKIVWSESGIAAYRTLISSTLTNIQANWKNPSSVAFSVALQATNEALTAAAKATNKIVDLTNESQLKQTSLHPDIIASNKNKHEAHKFWHNTSENPDTTEENKEKAKQFFVEARKMHRQVCRRHEAISFINRDKDLDTILTQNPQAASKALRSHKATASSKISELKVNNNIAFARGGAHLPIAHALRLLFLDEIEIEKK